MHVHTFMYIVAKYEITKFTSNRGQCAYYTTKRPPTKTQSLPQWHFYGFALCRQVDGLSAGDWQLVFFVSSGVYFPHTPPTVAGVFVVPIREWPSLKNRNSCLFGCQVDNGRSSFWRVLVNPWIYMYRFMVIRMDVSEKALYPRWLWCLRSDQMRTN